MKLKMKAVVRAFTVTLCAVLMLGTINVMAYEIEFDVEVITTGGRSYETWASLYVGSTNKYRAGAWIMTEDSSKLPAKSMGVMATLYDEDGEALISTKMIYNQAPTHLCTVQTAKRTVTSAVYGQGTVEILNGSYYRTYTTDKTSTEGGSQRAMAEFTAEYDEYPVNQAGETYGSALLAKQFGETPTLISALGVDGTHGYIRANELFPEVQTVEDAEAYMAEIEAREADSWFIPLYNAQGQTTGSFYEVVMPETEPIEEVEATIKELNANISSYNVNSKGETYGPGSLARQLGYHPEFISAIGTDGQSGYIRFTDLCPVLTPEEVGEYMKNYKSYELIPLYDFEGNEIGQFEVSSS